MLRSSNRALVSMVAVFLILLVTAAILRERMTTPADEMRLLLPYCLDVVRAEEALYQKQRGFGSWEDLEKEHTELGASLSKSVPSGYSTELTSTRTTYALRVGPGGRDGMPSARRLSLFADQTGIIRFSYGSRKAGPASDPVPANWQRAR